MIQEQKKPYAFMVTGKNGMLEEYSGRFTTREEAIKWRDSPYKGLMLQHVFRRELVLTFMGGPEK